MEGGGPEIENMVFSNNLNESTNKEVERKESEAGEAEKGSGVISNFISAFVSSRGKDDQEVEVDEEAIKSDASEEENKEEKEGGLLNHLISMVTPNQHGSNTESEDGENALNSEVESDKSGLIVEDKDGGGGVIQNLTSNILHQKNGENNKIGEDEKVSEDGGGRDIVENGDSHLPINGEDKFGTAPAIEEASILIHSIVHD